MGEGYFSSPITPFSIKISTSFRSPLHDPDVAVDSCPVSAWPSMFLIPSLSVPGQLGGCLDTSVLRAFLNWAQRPSCHMWTPLHLTCSRTSFHTLPGFGVNLLLGAYLATGTHYISHSRILYFSNIHPKFSLPVTLYVLSLVLNFLLF